MPLAQLQLKYVSREIVFQGSLIRDEKWELLFQLYRFKSCSGYPLYSCNIIYNLI